MKKLTKRVQAGGLWFDVEEGINFITFDADGEVSTHQNEPKANDGYWLSRWANLEIQVDLEGTDWRECCWYVGDQTDGESVERREWVARGAEKVLSRLERGTVSAGNYEGVCLSIKIGKSVLKEIRAGEVE